MRRLRLLLAAGGAILFTFLTPLGASAGAGVNDYPYKNAHLGVIDPWGMLERQCVSFVAWRLHQHGYNVNWPWGPASHWAVAAREHQFKVGTVPEVGAVAQWNANEKSAYYFGRSTTPNGIMWAASDGHVAWVIKVYADHSVLVEQYNSNGGDRSYSQAHVKAPRYLYITVRPPA